MTAVGVVGPDGHNAVNRALAAIEAADAIPHTGDATTVLDTGSEVIVAVGEPALLAVARAEPDVPVLPVVAGQGVQSVPESDVESAVAGLLDDVSTVDRQLLSVAVDGESVGPALFDVTLTATEPARISEYAVATGSATVADFRADGVVVATPAGSQGYARHADGPVVAPGVGAVVAAPIAPFAIDLDHWILDLREGVRLAVEREEVPVSLLVDDRQIREVGSDDPIEIDAGGTLSIAVVPESQSFFGE